MGCQREHGADTVAAEAGLPSNLRSHQFFYQKEKASSGFCLPLSVALIQKCLFASYRRDNSSLCVPDFDKRSVSQNDTAVSPRQFQLVNFDLIMNDLYTPRTQDNFLTFSNEYNHLQVYKHFPLQFALFLLLTKYSQVSPKSKFLHRQCVIRLNCCITEHISFHYF